MKFITDFSTVSRYEPGEREEVVRRRYGLERVVKLASNEFPLPPVAGVMEAIASRLGDLNRYPDTYATDLREALAAKHDRRIEEIAVGNGSLELLLILGEALLQRGVEAVFAKPSFALYRRMCDLHAATPVAVPLRDGSHDLKAMAAAVTERTAMVVVCNPNNPTGTYVPAAAIATLLERVPDDVLVVVDEAYNEFVTERDREDVIALAGRRENLVVTRTFSKIYGLCALRVGYAVCSQAVRGVIDAIRQPFNVNLLAQVAACEALRHETEIEERRRATARLRRHLVERLAERERAFVPSQANFVLVDLHGLTVPVENACQKLMSLGAVVRDGAAFGLTGWARVSVGTAEEVDFFLDKLETLEAPAGV